MVNILNSFTTSTNSIASKNMNNTSPSIGRICRECRAKFRCKSVYEEHAYRMEEADELNEILAKELYDIQQEGMDEEKEVNYFKGEIE